MVEYVESRRNLSMNCIEVINEVNEEVMESRLIRPTRLISPIEDSLQHIAHKLLLPSATMKCILKGNNYDEWILYSRTSIYGKYS